MRYMVAHLIKGSVGEYHRNLTRELSQKFGIVPLHDRIPPHLTLKSPFDYDKDRLSEIEKVVSEIARTHTPEPLTFSGFSHFDERVIYIGVRPSESAFNLIHDLVEEMALNPLTPLTDSDRKKHLHATVAARGIEHKFDRIMEYVSTLDVNFEAMLDNLAILKKLEGRWIIHREYRVGR